MAADVVDLDTAKTGLKRAGAYFSIWSMVRKLAYALGITFATTIVTIAGFDSLVDPINTTNTLFSLMVLTCVYSIVPASFMLITLPLLSYYNLDEKRVRQLQAESDRKLETI